MLPFPKRSPSPSVMLLFMLQLLPLPKRPPSRFYDVTHSSCYDCYHSLNCHPLWCWALIMLQLSIVINSLYRPIRGSSLSRALYFLSSGDNFSVVWGHFCVLRTCDLGQHVWTNPGFCLLRLCLFRRQERNVSTEPTKFTLLNPFQTLVSACSKRKGWASLVYFDDEREFFPLCQTEL